MENIEKEFTDFLQNVYKDFGLDTLSSKLISILFIEPDEISIEELSNRTGYSLASISNKMRVLENLGVAKRIKKPGTKKVFYFVEKDVVKLQIKKIEAFTNKFMTPAKEILPRIIEKNKDKPVDEMSRKKLKIISDYYQQMLKIEKALKHLEKYLKEI